MTKARDTGEVLNTRGTAATADVQASPTDTTTGRVIITDSLDSDGNIWGASNVEYGVNADGEYWKYPDGLLICKSTQSIASGTPINAGLGYYFRSNPASAWSYPLPFIATPSVSASCSSFPVRSIPTTTSSNFALLGFDNTFTLTLDEDVYLTAIGKWK